MAVAVVLMQPAGQAVVVLVRLVVVLAYQLPKLLAQAERLIQAVAAVVVLTTM